MHVLKLNHFVLSQLVDLNSFFTLLSYIYILMPASWIKIKRQEGVLPAGINLRNAIFVMSCWMPRIKSFNLDVDQNFLASFA